jgi:hypothetical protein
VPTALPLAQTLPFGTAVPILFFYRFVCYQLAQLKIAGKSQKIRNITEK